MEEGGFTLKKAERLPSWLKEIRSLYEKKETQGPLDEGREARQALELKGLLEALPDLKSPPEQGRASDVSTNMPISIETLDFIWLDHLHLGAFYTKTTKNAVIRST